MGPKVWVPSCSSKEDHYLGSKDTKGPSNSLLLHWLTWNRFKRVGMNISAHAVSLFSRLKLNGEFLRFPPSFCTTKFNSPHQANRPEDWGPANPRGLRSVDALFYFQLFSCQSWLFSCHQGIVLDSSPSFIYTRVPLFVIHTFHLIGLMEIPWQMGNEETII